MKIRIENSTDLMEWCKDVNTGLTNKAICDLQDIYARSDEKTIKGSFLTAEMYDKELIVFCVQKIMGSEPMFSLMKAWAREQAARVILEQDKDIDERYQNLTQAEINFQKEKTDIYKQLKDLQDAIVTLNGKYQDSLKVRAEHINKITDLENDNEMLYAENKRLSDFEKHIKSLLVAP